MVPELFLVALSNNTLNRETCIKRNIGSPFLTKRDQSVPGLLHKYQCCSTSHVIEDTRAYSLSDKFYSFIPLQREKSSTRFNGSKDNADLLYFIPRTHEKFLLHVKHISQKILHPKQLIFVKHVRTVYLFNLQHTTIMDYSKAFSVF